MHLILLERARQLIAAGLSVIPLRLDGSKAPAIPSWREYQQRQATDDELQQWFGRGPIVGIGLVGGYGGLAILDIDDGGYVVDVCKTLSKSWPDIWQHASVVDTPRPGRHIIVRTSAETKCEKLSHRRDDSGGVSAFIEIKAAGGYVVDVASPAEVHPSGQPYRLVHGLPVEQLSIIDAMHYEKLRTIGRLFTQVEPQRTEYAREPYIGEPRPGDIFDRLADWPQLLEEAGWTLSHERGDESFWRRPGKEDGWSAVLGYFADDATGQPLLSVFSSSLPYGPKDDRTASVLSPFDFFAHAMHGGRFDQAASAAAELFAPQLQAAQAAYWQQQPAAEGLRQLSEFAPEPVRWVWPGFIARGKTTMFSGREGIGKSFAFIDLAARITQGGQWPCGALNTAGEGTVVLLSAEDDPGDTFRPRFDSAGGDSDRLLIEQMTKQIGDCPPQMLTILGDIQHTMHKALNTVRAKSLPPLQLLVVDPITGFLGDADANSSGSVRSVMAMLQSVAREYDVAIIAVNHHGKDTTRGVGQRYLGSTSFRAAVRTAIDVMVDPRQQDRRIFALTKSNISAANIAMAFTQVQAGSLGQNRRIEWEPSIFEFDASQFEQEDRRTSGKAQQRAALQSHLEQIVSDPTEPWPKQTTLFRESLAGQFDIGAGTVTEVLREAGFVSIRSAVPGQTYFVTWPPGHRGPDDTVPPGYQGDQETSTDKRPQRPGPQLIDEVVWSNAETREDGEVKDDEETKVDDSETKISYPDYHNTSSISCGPGRRGLFDDSWQDRQGTVPLPPNGTNDEVWQDRQDADPSHPLFPEDRQDEESEEWIEY